MLGYVIDLLGLLVGLFFGIRAERAYSSLWNVVDSEIIELILNRLNNGTLRDSQQVKGLIKNIVSKYHLPMPNDKKVTRLLRRMALSLEKKYDEKKFKVLEKVRKGFDPAGDPLYSIASVNRFTALLIVMFMFFLALIIIQYFYLEDMTIAYNRYLKYVIIFVELLIIASLLSLSVHYKKRLKEINTD